MAPISIFPREDSEWLMDVFHDDSASAGPDPFVRLGQTRSARGSRTRRGGRERAGRERTMAGDIGTARSTRHPPLHGRRPRHARRRFPFSGTAQDGTCEDDKDVTDFTPCQES